MFVLSSSSHTQQLSHPKYRADIDGLRAIAVLAVIGFHAFPEQIRGGFIGVDIFFVISGFLISSILFESLAQERFSLIQFYSRRVRRIFPALLVVLISCFVFGWFALMENEFAQLGKHIGAGAAFVSNIIFWRESGYFDAAAETKPLLHLWSLGIEEQYYIFWPLMLWIVWKHRDNLLLPLVLLLLLSSFALNIRYSDRNSVAAFYSLQTRAWELLAGSLLAYISILIQPSVRYFRSGKNNVVGFCSIALLGVGLMFITKERSFPGWWALLPIIGAAFLILAGPHSWINRVVLSHPLLVSVGLISYPLYLWHWPLLTYAHILEGERVAFGMRAFLAALAFPLAWLTYKYVEVPIRFGRFKSKSFIHLLIAMTGIGCVGLITYKNNGLPSRSVARVIHEGDVGHDVFFDYLNQHYFPCSNQDIQKEALRFNGISRCFQSKQSGPIQIVLVGDSLAEHLYIGLAENLPSKNVAYYIKASLPLANNKDFDNIFHNISKIEKPEVVIFSAFWARRINREAKGFDFQTELAKTLDLVSSDNRSIFLVDGTPNFSFDPLLCHKERLIWPKVKCSESAHSFMKAYSGYYPILDSIVKERNHVSHLHTAKYFQIGDTISMNNGDDLLFRDDRHLNIRGSQYLGRILVKENPGLAISH